MKFRYLLPILICPLFFTACGDDDDELDPSGGGTVVNPNDPDIPGGDDNPSGSMELLSGPEAKQHLSSTANEFLSKFRTRDQQELMNLTGYFLDKYGDIDLPEQWNDVIDENSSYYSPARFMRALSRYAASGNGASLAAAVSTYTYNFNFPAFTGVYEPGYYRWDKVADSSDIIFRFADRSGARVELKVTASSSSSQVDFDYEDSWYDYWSDQRYTDRYYNHLSLPHTISLSLTRGGDTLASGKIDSRVNINGHTFSADITATAANVSVSANVSGTDSQITTTATQAVNGAQLVNMTATLTGNKLCNKDAIRDAVENGMDNDDILSFFQNAKGSADIMGKVQLSLDGRLNRSVLDVIDDGCYWDCWDYSSRSEAESACRSAINTLNDAFKGEVRYNRSSTLQATLLFKPYFDSWYGDQYWEYGVDMVLKFAADNSEFGLGEYFERGFSSVSDLWETTIDSYVNAWDAAY